MLRRLFCLALLAAAAPASAQVDARMFRQSAVSADKIAFVYAGDIYAGPAPGGTPVRLTHHPMPDRVVGWHPDGKRVLFASGRESGRQRYNQFYLASVEGGLPEKLPVPYGEFGAFSPDAARFV